MAIKSYKGFDKNLRCRDFQYKIGGIYEMDGEIKVCSRGFHACESPFDVFESLYGFIPIGDVWKYKNGRAVKDKLEYFDIEIDDKGKIYCKETYYRTREDVYKFNDLTVVDRNGDIRLVESSKSRLMLSDDQLDVVERMKGIIDDMVRLKMIMYIDQDYNLCFLPGDKIEALAMDETDGFVDTTGIVTSIKSKDVVEFYVENPFVKIKGE